MEIHISHMPAPMEEKLEEIAVKEINNSVVNVLNTHNMCISVVKPD
jgi:hypothetical protein